MCVCVRAHVHTRSVVEETHQELIFFMFILLFLIDYCLSVYQQMHTAAVYYCLSVYQQMHTAAV